MNIKVSWGCSRTEMFACKASKDLKGFEFLYATLNDLSTQKFHGCCSKTEKNPCKAFKDFIRF
jgi:hypothetical protein